MDVRVGLWRKPSTEKLMLLNCGVGEDSWESLGLQGDQSWVFIGRTNAEAPILWPPHAKSWLIGKDSDAGRDWGQEEKWTTEDEMAGWHHWLDGHEFWVNSQSWWWTGRHGVLQFTGSQRVGQDWAAELNWTESGIPPPGGDVPVQVQVCTYSRSSTGRPAPHKTSYFKVSTLKALKLNQRYKVFVRACFRIFFSLAFPRDYHLTIAIGALRQRILVLSLESHWT